MEEGAGPIEYLNHLSVSGMIQKRKKRDEVRKRGVQNRRKEDSKTNIDYEIKKYSDIQKLIEIAINKLMKGNSTAREARAIGYLCNLARTIKGDAEFEI